MAKFLDAGSLMEEFNKLEIMVYNDETFLAYADVLAMLQTAETVSDVRPERHGHWKPIFDTEGNKLLGMMDKERLIELIKNAEKTFSGTGKPILDIEEYVADYLLKKGVVVLPCNVGDTVYKLHYNHCCTFPDQDYYSIDEKKFSLDMLKEINNTVFLTRDEAEQTLKGR